MKTFLLILLALCIAELKYWTHEKGYGPHKKVMSKKRKGEWI